MASRIAVTDLPKVLSDILNRVRYRGDQFIIERNGEPVAILGPSGPFAGISLRAAADRLSSLCPPGDGFADGLEALQASQPRLEGRTWQS